MEKLCGRLELVGGLGGGEIVQAGRRGMVVQTATEISVVQVGYKELVRPRCSSDVFHFLDPARDVCLDVFRHLFYKPVILGVKFADNGFKYTTGLGSCLGACAQCALLWPVLLGIPFAIVGWIVGGLLGSVLPLESAERPEISSAGVGSALGLFFGVVAAVAVGFANAFRIFRDYLRMKAD